jgi:acetyl-CoA acetyltransferase
MSRKDTYIIDAVRTPIGNFGGTLSKIRVDDLAAHVIKTLISRYDFDAGQIDDVIIGCANQAGEDNRNVARMALLLAGIPFSVPGETINRLCASGMSAVIHAHRAIQSDDGELFIAGGVEHMTRGPWVISKASKPFGRDSKMEDSSFGWRFINPKMEEIYGTEGMGQTAENVAEIPSILGLINRHPKLESSIFESLPKGLDAFEITQGPLVIFSTPTAINKTPSPAQIAL